MPLKTNLKIIFLPLLLITLAFITSLLAGTITNNATPVPTGYTLTDIYNLIHNNTTATEANHSLSATTSPTATTSYSVSQLYADLANLIKRENLETGTTYLGVTGLYDTPDPAYATTTVLPSSLDAQGTAGDSYGYSLDDIYELITNNATTTAHSHPDTPDSTPASSMHTLTEIYTELSTLIDPTKVKPGVTYLAQAGSYDPGCTTDPATGFYDGDGSPGDPYQICSWTQLAHVNNHLSENFILVENLSSATDDYTGLGSNWTPIGRNTSQFTGSFDGNGYTISNLTISTTTSYVGLFGYTTGDISRMSLNSINIAGGAYTGGLIGYKSGGTVSTSTTQGIITGSGNTVGGLIGYHGSGTILDSGADVDISASGRSNVGGLIGYQANGTVYRSYAKGTVGAAGNIGGFVGYFNQGFVYDSYASGNITSTNRYVGGFIGWMANGSITNSYATGDASALDNAGGFIGRGGSEINNCYSTGSVSGASTIGGFIGYSSAYAINNSGWWTGSATDAIGDSASGPQHSLTYDETNKSVFYVSTHDLYDTVVPYWDFSTVWNTPSGNYPTLAWE
jgi:hypothetical protein